MRGNLALSFRNPIRSEPDALDWYFCRRIPRPYCANNGASPDEKSIGDGRTGNVTCPIGDDGPGARRRCRAGSAVRGDRVRAGRRGRRCARRLYRRTIDCAFVGHEAIGRGPSRPETRQAGHAGVACRQPACADCAAGGRASAPGGRASAATVNGGFQRSAGAGSRVKWPPGSSPRSHASYAVRTKIARRHCPTHAG
jgi:hypothetical protein